MSSSEPPKLIAPLCVPIVGIGASAGGIHALQELFSALPAQPGAAFVVILHLDPTHQSELASILQLRTLMPVVQVNGRLNLEANHVYVISPDHRLMVKGSDIATAPFDERRGQRAPIDLFFRSLAEEHGDGFAVILSGSGSDGSSGVLSVKQNGGIVLVQDPEEAEFPMMPRSAIAAGADFVLPIKQIASKLVDLIRAKGRIETGSSTDDDLLQRILTQIRSKTGQDFSHYKRPTLTRRIARRMQVTHVDGLTDYLAYLRGNAEEVQALFKDLLISVTSFFRDSHAYKTLAELVVPHLLEREKGRPIRVWVPGCATGEEAYSLAILILEEAAKHEAHVTLQVFASDLDAGALAAARAGRYSRAIETAVGPDRLARFFTLEGDYYCVRQELRDQVVFAAHGLLKDPPFSKLDLISCRNLMIYLDRELQEQACRTFHYALCPGGYLFLGTSETADHPPGLFRALDREARIYQANAHTRSPLPPLPTILPPAVTGVAKATTAVASSPANDDASHRKALEQLGPPSMLVDAKLSILHLSESAGRYFQLPAGRPTNDAGSMVRPELRLDVQAGLHRAFEHDKRTVTLPIPVKFNGTAQAVVVQVTPIKEDGKVRKALVLFIEGGPTDPDLQVQGSSEASPVVVQLREQLLASKSMLRTTREQYDTAMEDLKAANEELQSINEEYRSTAEELETSKEELQSINEELQTLNNELKLKFDMVSRAHNDLQNLMGATDIATLFLDKEMRIKRFTPRTTDLFSIHVGDEGRPITDFTHRLEYEEFVADAQLVLRDLVPIERTIHTVDDLWLTTRLRPYRTLDDKIEGIVVTFFDITERRRADSAWAARQQMLLTESGHRIKNMLAVVHAIVFQTFKMSSGRADQDLCNLILDRLKALANTHDMLVHADWKSIKMHDLVQNQLAPYLANNRIAIEGPPVQIDAANAAPLGLILHELATNALKYGALSVKEGKVDLTWTRIGIEDDHKLKIVWREHDGPTVTPPTSRGLGTALIEHGIAGSRAQSSFDAAGVTWTFEVPLQSAATNSLSQSTH